MPQSKKFQQSKPQQSVSRFVHPFVQNLLCSVLLSSGAIALLPAPTLAKLVVKDPMPELSTPTPVDSAPVDSTLGDDLRVDEMQGNSVTVESAPVDSTPIDSTPGDSTPVNPSPANLAPPDLNKPTQVDSQDKGLLDDLFNRGGGGRVCLGPLCINPGQITERIVMEQLRKLVRDDAPVTVSDRNLYSTARSLPGEDFSPTLLYLADAPAQGEIPPGDYVLLVQTYCLDAAATTPDGHRYRLGRYGGDRREVLQALNQAAATSPYSQSEVQGLSWFVQSGGTYDQMPRDMQAIANELIPQHRDTLNQKDFLEEVREIGNQVTSLLGYSSFDSFLRQEMGDVGNALVELMQLREDLQQTQNWRTVADRYFADPANAAGGLGGSPLDTPWSRLDDGYYARFVTEGNADDVGVLMVRTEEPQTVESFTRAVTEMAAVPEGGGNIQPLAMTPLQDPDWWGEFAMTFGDLGFFAGRQLCGVATAPFNRFSVVCQQLDRTRESMRPNVPGGLPWLHDIPTFTEYLRRRSPAPNPRRLPEPANDNRRPPTPANDNRRPPVPANDNSPGGRSPQS